MGKWHYPRQKLCNYILSLVDTNMERLEKKPVCYSWLCTQVWVCTLCKQVHHSQRGVHIEDDFSKVVQKMKL